MRSISAALFAGQQGCVLVSAGVSCCRSGVGQGVVSCDSWVAVLCPGVSPCRHALMVITKERERRVEVCEASRELARHPFHHILPAKQVQERGNRLPHTRQEPCNVTWKRAWRQERRRTGALNASDPKTYHDTVLSRSIATSHQWVFRFNAD